ncbi:acyl-CoA dehydrogenase family protein [Micromonospora andamanensis]|uniref:Acyl-CoA dehydrogenase n=1 Tax=Micromonospora andamanensis TaxID=1287068 RepID=A0ABQ4HTL2_9ACTN|nr:acyl-CoA dehydrogenase family protein [Micromonospora andamanensis]GIJ08962.1 acyl-CoA dehydrogenase [Micromonospora andamanensis]
MRLHDDEQEAEFRASLRVWLREHLPPVPEVGARRWTPAELRGWNRTLWTGGYAGMSWPVSYGGCGAPPAVQEIFVAESARAGAPDHANLIGLNMVGPTVIRHGTAVQRDTYLPGILRGDTLFCQGFSEPEAGSDLAAIRTRAVPAPDGGYRITGEKIWSSYADTADACLLLARTDGPPGRHDGLTCFLVDMSTPGVTVQPLRQMSGDADFSRITLTDVAVPESAVVGPAGSGWRVAMTTLAHERGTLAVTLVARLAVQFDRLRRTVVAAGADRDRSVRDQLATLHVEVEALRCTAHRAVATAQGGDPAPEATVLKLRWSEVDQRVCALGFDVATPRSPWRAYWERERLRSRTSTIEGGTSEILRGIVAERVLGLPRSR